MFPGGFFAKTFFAGTYFAPADGGEISDIPNIEFIIRARRVGRRC